MPSLTLDLACAIPLYQIKKLEYELRGEVFARNHLFLSLREPLRRSLIS
jgi:hypothetical protein